MAAREHVELPIEDAGVADVAALSRVYRNVFVPLIPFLVSQLFRVMGVLLDFRPQVLNFLLVVLEAAAQVLLHVFDLGFFWELL